MKHTFCTSQYKVGDTMAKAKEHLIKDYNQILARVSDIEYEMFKKVKQHYGFRTNSDTIKALIKRAALNIK